MNETITIHTATVDDAAIVASLAKEIWNQHFVPIIGQPQVDYMLNKFQSQSAITQAITDGYVYSIAYNGDTPCGYCGVKLDNGVFLSKLYVRQSQRGKGVGKAMLSAIYAYGRQHGAQRIWLTCNKHNTKTLDVYDKLGFAIVRNVTTDIGGGFVMDDFILEKMLVHSDEIIKPMDISIKTATIDNAPRIAALAAEIYTQHYLPILGQAQIDYMLHEFQSENAIKADITHGCVYYITFLDDALCGYSAVNIDDGAFLSKFYVRQSQRSKGVGKAMLVAVETYAKSICADRIWLKCLKHNTDSLAAYKRLGFAIIQDVITDIGCGFVMDDYILEKQL